MRYLHSFLFVLFLSIGQTIQAQNPYAELGVETKVLTLSNGKYQEFIPNDTLVAIGSAMFNTITGEVVGFIDPDTVVYSFEPTIATRFLSVDPIARQFPELTPYQFAGNTPIQAIDLDGLEPYFVNDNSANRVANDINAIFYNEYGDENAKTAVRIVKKVETIPNEAYGLWDKYGWGNDPETITEERFYLIADENFDWKKDRYTRALNDILNATVPVKVDLVNDRRIAPEQEYLKGDEFTEGGWFDRENDRQWEMIWGIGGGTVEHFPTVKLSNKLLDTKIGDAPSTYDFTIGGVFLHEFIYHLHPLGKAEDLRPQIMRNFYNIATNNHALSKDHPAGSRTGLIYTPELFE